jgi:hypothetical protein
MKIQPSGVNRKGISLTPRWGIMAALERPSPAHEQSMIHEMSVIEKGIYTLGRSSDKYAAPRFSTFPLNSTAPMKIQPSGVNRKGISLAPWWGQSCLHWSVPTPRSCQRPRLEDHNHESKSERSDRGRRQMMKKRQNVRLGKRNGGKKSAVE